MNNGVKKVGGVRKGRGNRPGRHLIRKAVRLIHKNGASVPDAMQAIGYAKSTANHHQERLTNNPAYKQEVDSVKRALLRLHPKIHDRVAQAMSAGLKAKETKFFQHEGTVMDHRNVIAWGERRQMSGLILQLLGEIGQKDQPPGMTINVDTLINIVNQNRIERGLVERKVA